jgi:hypothetical protein
MDEMGRKTSEEGGEYGGRGIIVVREQEPAATQCHTGGQFGIHIRRCWWIGLSEDLLVHLARTGKSIRHHVRSTFNRSMTYYLESEPTMIAELRSVRFALDAAVELVMLGRARASGDLNTLAPALIPPAGGPIPMESNEKLLVGNGA